MNNIYEILEEIDNAIEIMLRYDEDYDIKVKADTFLNNIGEIITKLDDIVMHYEHIGYVVNTYEDKDFCIIELFHI